jgi:hypothetical protein
MREILFKRFLSLLYYRLILKTTLRKVIIMCIIIYTFDSFIILLREEGLKKLLI